MSLKNLSEAIILQSAEDLLSVSHRKEGLEFFSGEGFRLAAEMAGMTFEEKLDLLQMLLGCISSGKKAGQCTKEILGNREANKPHTHKYRKGALLNAV